MRDPDSRERGHVGDPTANQRRGRKNRTSRVTITIRPRKASGNEWNKKVQEFPHCQAKNIRQYPRKITSSSHKAIVISSKVRRVMLSPFGAGCSERLIFVPVPSNLPRM